MGISLPAARPNSRSAFRKAAMRKSWDFALASAAVYCEMEGEVCKEAHVVLGAVAPTPWRARDAETALRGNRVTDRIEDAVRASVNGAQPLPHNEYKIGLVKNLVRECLEEISGPNAKT
jgi:xanthine dehydrogenase YagS FAD-binding subunit